MKYKDNLSLLSDTIIPFDLSKWLSNLYPYNKLHEFLMSSKPTQVQLERHWNICNCYALRVYEKECLSKDMLKFNKILNKFNFFNFLNNTNVFFRNSETRKVVMACRLIKSLKWESSKTEGYLIHCIRVFGCENITKIIEDFIIAH